MGFDICGWVELTTFTEDEQDEYSWMGVIRISSVIDVSDVFSDAFFGLSKDAVRRDSVVAPAGARGVPPNPSAEVQAELRAIADHEAKYGPGEFGGYTYASWREVAAFLPKLSEPPEPSWQTLFALVARLAEDYRFSPERIRLVVWYGW